MGYESIVVSPGDQDPATIGAYHTGDIPFFFGTLDTFNLLARILRQMIDQGRVPSKDDLDRLLFGQ